MKAIILAGGNGSRLKKYNYSQTNLPKPMLRVGDMPLLELIVKQLFQYGFTDVIISTGFRSEIIENYFKSASIPGGKISFSKQEPLLGTVGALSVIPDLNETFLVIDGDILTDLDFRKLVDFHNKNKGVITIATKKLCNSEKIDNFELEGNLIKSYYEVPAKNYVFAMGVFVCEPTVLKYLKKGEFMNLDKLVNDLGEVNEKVFMYLVDNYILDIGTDESYELANKEFLKERFLPSLIDI